MKKITAIVWHSAAARLREAADSISDEINAAIYSGRALDLRRRLSEE